MGWTGRAVPAQRGSSLVGGVLVAQRAQPAGQVGELEGIPAQHVDVVAYERRQPGDVFVAEWKPAARSWVTAASM